MKRINILFFLLFISLQGLAQEGAVLIGKVNDAGSKPVEFVNAILMNGIDSSLVKGAISDASGTYTFESVSPGEYIVMLSQIGYSKYYLPLFSVSQGSLEHVLSTVTLMENTVQLKDANIVAMKPFIERRVDRTIVNVENSIVDAGSTALEILKRSPGVVVDNDGNISIRGKQGVLVLIDDKPTYLSSSDLHNMLRNMTSDQLSGIEIITNPSSRYDASGNSGILNIKLRKKQNIGVNGSVTISYGQGQYPDFGGGTNLNYRNERFNVFGNYNYMYGYYFEEIELNRRFIEADHTSRFIQNTFDKGRYINNNFRAGLDYFLTEKQTLGFQLRGYSSQNRDRSTSRTDIYNYSAISDSGYVTLNENDSRWQNISTNFNYRYKIDSLGREISTDIDYGRYDNKSDFRFQTDHHFNDGSQPSYRELATNNQPAMIDIRSVKLDYVHPFSDKVKLEGGLKSSFVKTDSDVKYYSIYGSRSVLDTGKSNHFIYKENINAAYLSAAFEHKKIGVQIGLRAEQTIADGNQLAIDSKFHRNYIQFFPTAFLSYAFSDNYEARFSYSKRIDRPGYQDLNPFRYFLDPYNYMEGNPELQPQLTNSFELSQTFLKLFTISGNYRHTMEAMTQISKQIDSTRTTFLTTENLEENDTYGVSISVPVQLTKWWYTSNNVNVFNNRYKGISSVGAVDKRLSSYSVNSYNSISLPRSWSMEISGYYNSRMVWGTLLIDPHFSVSAGFRKAFMDEKFTLRINVNDIFHTESFNSEIKYQNVDADYNRSYDSQFVRLHVSYNFGKKSVPRVRQRATGSQDEENRIKTGR
jgi:hypothetical protein